MNYRSLPNTIVTIAALLVGLAACGMPAASTTSTTPVPEPASWSLRLTTSGGFSGRGMGNIAITSAGAASYEAPSATGQAAATCAKALPDATRKNITAAVAAAVPSKWQAPGPSAGADMFGYTLTLQTVTGKAATLSWDDGTYNQLSGDARTLADATLAALGEQATACEAQPSQTQ